MGDASSRLIELLTTADIVAAEDTRRFTVWSRTSDVTVAGRVISYHEHNEAAKTRNCWTQVRAGKTLVMVTDAGMPSVSDPGFRLVEGAVAAGLTVTAVPGPLRGADRAGAVRAAHGPVLLRRLPAAQGRGARLPAGRTRPPSAGPWCSSRRRTGWSQCSVPCMSAFGAERAGRRLP